MLPGNGGLAMLSRTESEPARMSRVDKEIVSVGSVADVDVGSLVNWPPEPDLPVDTWITSVAMPAAWFEVLCAQAVEEMGAAGPCGIRI